MPCRVSCSASRFSTAPAKCSHASNSAVSRIEMMIPVLLIGVLISAFQFVLSETVVPAATREAKYLFEVELKGRQLEGVFANRHIWIRVRDGFLFRRQLRSQEVGVRGHHALSPRSRLRASPIFFTLQCAHWNGKRWMPHEVTRYKYRRTAPCRHRSRPDFSSISPPPIWACCAWSPRSSASGSSTATSTI